MLKTLYMHIGNQRTATTSIQSFLQKNAGPLAKQGYFSANGRRRHDTLMHRLFSGNLSMGKFVQDLQTQATQHKAKHGVEQHSVFITDEAICQRKDLTQIDALKEHFDVKIIFALRRQDLWLESWYFQNIKWQWDPKLAHLTFDEFLERRGDFHWAHYDQHLRMIEGHFGQENISLLPFETGQLPDGPVNAFCRLMGLKDLSAFSQPQHLNGSLSATMVEFIRNLPMDAIPEPQRELVRYCLQRVDKEVFGHCGRQSERLLKPDHRRQILSEYAEGNAAVAQRYFGRDDLFRDPLPADDTPLAELKIPSDSSELMEQFVVPFITQLVLDDMLKAPGEPKPTAPPQTARKVS